jgi:hypothetical protein
MVGGSNVSCSGTKHRRSRAIGSLQAGQTQMRAVEQPTLIGRPGVKKEPQKVRREGLVPRS